MNAHDYSYNDLLKMVFLYGERRTDRTGTGTRSIFGAQHSFNLADGRVPVIGSKKVIWEKALLELSWMLRGETNIAGLGKAANIWKPWADENGDLGPVYGAQWRSFGKEALNEANPDIYDPHIGIDQIQYVVSELRENPDSRRAFISSWNPLELEEMALPPCPVSYQFSLRGENYDELHLHVYQRSADLFLGVPFDLVNFAVLAHVIGHALQVKTSWMQVSYGDVHIYGNHMEQVRKMLQEGAPETNDPRISLKKGISYLDGSVPLPAITGYEYSTQVGYVPGAIAV